MLSRIRRTLPVHPTITDPRTGRPLEAIGVLPSGRVVWPVMGGDGTGGDAGGQGGDGAGAGGGQAGDGGQQGGSNSGGGQQTGDTGGGQQQGQQQTGQQQTGGDGLPDDPAALKTMIADLRRENASARTNAKQQAADEARQQLVDDLAKALGLKPDDTPADPAQLQATIGQLQSGNRALEIQLAATVAAEKAGARIAGLLDSRSFVDAVSKLDPTAADFQTSLDNAVKAALEANPSLRVGQAPARGGSEFNGGGTGANSKPTSLHEAVAARLASA